MVVYKYNEIKRNIHEFYIQEVGGEQMVKIIMRGCNGKMGQVITELVREDEEAVIVAGLDIVDNRENGYPVYKSLEECDIEADVLIDFSSANGLEETLDVASERKMAVVLCSTGLSEEQIQYVNEISKQIPVLRSANMSMGINTIMKVLKEVTKVLVDANFDIEIVERHHNQKLDAPSGTALALADVINEVLENSYVYTFDRSKELKKRQKKEIGISAVRGGTIVGEHEIIFAGTDEAIEIKHTAYSKAIFAKGAIQAAKYLPGKESGLYDMSHVIG